MQDTKRYRLVRPEQPDRVEDLSADKAKVRNMNLEKKGKAHRWVEDPTAADTELTDSPAIREKQAADNKRAGAQIEAKAKTAKLAVAKATGGRVEWNGFSMVEVIRYCGSKDYNSTQTRAIATHCGMDPAKGTIHIQLGVGRKGDGIPKLSKDQRADLDTIAKANKEPKAAKRTKLKEEVADIIRPAAVVA